MPFAKTFRVIKGFVRNSVDKVKQGFKKYGHMAVDYSQKGLGLLGTLPGKIDAVARTAQYGADVLKKYVNEIPNEAAKSKLTGLIDKGSNIINKGAVASSHFAQQMANRAAPWVQAGTNIVKHGSNT